MHWRIGGITETFQSTLLMMLAERGRINLDDRLSKWYPRLPNADKVTVRMLVQCRAGYVDYVRVKAFLDLMTAEPFRSFTPDELIAYAMKGGKTNYPPGTSQQYSHTELVILSQVMEKATGQSLKSLYEQYILGPEGLKDTRYPSDQEIQEPVLHAFSNDRGVFEDATYFNPSWGAGNGALTSTILDIGRWGPIFGQGRLVSPASFKEMTAPSSVGLGRNRPDLYFAYEFAVSNGWYFQNPAINGYSGAFAYNPKHDITIVVAATKNASPTVDPAAFPIMRAVIEHVTPDTPLAAF
jgi:CubicO group peptidase (beta-lactamase class C family)